MAKQNSTTQQQHYMSAALELAARGRLFVSPNPMVGCVIVKNGEIVGKGFHQRAGGDHAEIHALHEAGARANGATAYVTLEPCCHHGKTPPCTDALIRAGIAEVYTACIDPNPLVAKKGIEILETAGIAVHVGLYEEEAKQLNKIFFHHMTHKRPFVIAKWAMSLDGKTITHEEDSRQISGRESQQHTHELRQQVDAILIGSNTAKRDNPQLTSRLTFSDSDTHAFSKQPIRIILAGKTPLPLTLRIFDQNLPNKTILATTKASQEYWKNICATLPNPIELIIVNADERGLVHLPSLLDVLHKKGITSLLVEGGMTVHEQFFKENLVNEVDVYVSPVIIGNLKIKKTLDGVTCNAQGSDFHLRGYCKDTTHV